MASITRERPSYYDSFECRGNTTCIDSCCFAWDLPMDDDTVRLYQSYEGEFGEYLRSNIFQDEKGEWFIRLKEHGRCPFLTEDDLCIVRLKAGKNAQIRICDIYPREREIRVGDYVQERLLIACSEVARLLYTEAGDRLEFIKTSEQTDEEVSAPLKERVSLLLAFRDGMVKALQDGAFDDSLFGAYESAETFEGILDDALYFEGHELSENVFKRVRAILQRLPELRRDFYDRTEGAKGWLRKTAAYFAHRQLLDAVQDGGLEGPLISVFRSVHILELICLAVFDEKGSFGIDDMIFAAHIFGLTFEISIHNIKLMKQVRNTGRDEVYKDGENSELRPFLYP